MTSPWEWAARLNLKTQQKQIIQDKISSSLFKLPRSLVGGMMSKILCWKDECLLLAAAASQCSNGVETRSTPVAVPLKLHVMENRSQKVAAFCFRFHFRSTSFLLLAADKNVLQLSRSQGSKAERRNSLLQITGRRVRILDFCRSIRRTVRPHKFTSLSWNAAIGFRAQRRFLSLLLNNNRSLQTATSTVLKLSHVHFDWWNFHRAAHVW